MFSSLNALGLLVNFFGARRRHSLARPGALRALVGSADHRHKTEAGSLWQHDRISVDPDEPRSLARVGPRIDGCRTGACATPNVELVLWSLAGILLFGAFQWFNLRRIGRMTGAIPDFMRKLAERLLPNSPLELAPYCALAVTAGFCEEFLYRGFAMAAFSRMGITAWMAVIISSVLFGLAHTYQGKSGIVGTTVMGLVFGIARLAFQSLLPVMVWHSAVDLLAGVAGPSIFLRR